MRRRHALVLSCVLGVSGLDDAKARRLSLRQSRAFALASLAVLRTLDVAFIVVKCICTYQSVIPLLFGSLAAIRILDATVSCCYP